MLIPKSAPTKSRNYRRYKCAVPGCKSNSHDNLTVSFHKLPAPNKRVVCTSDCFGNSVQMDQLTAWTKALKIGDKLSHRMNICSLHFKKSDYVLADHPTQEPTLVKTAVPSVNLPGMNELNIEKDEKRLQRRRTRKSNKSSSVSSKTYLEHSYSAAPDAEESKVNDDENISAHDSSDCTDSDKVGGEHSYSAAPDAEESKVNDDENISAHDSSDCTDSDKVGGDHSYSAAHDAQDSKVNEDENISAHDSSDCTDSDKVDDYHQLIKRVRGDEPHSVGVNIHTGEAHDSFFVQPQDKPSPDFQSTTMDDNVEAAKSIAVHDEDVQLPDNEPLCNCSPELDLPNPQLATATLHDDVESRFSGILDDSEPLNILRGDKNDQVQKDSNSLTQQDILANKVAPVKKRRLLDIISTNKKLSTACGIESFDLFNSIVKCVKFATSDKWEKDNLMMNTKDRVLMVYSKLKQNLSYSYLAILFEISERHCTRMFIETLEVLSECLKCAIPWPSKETILSNLPQCFEKFENTRIVVDCTEIFVECPSKTCCRIHLFSYYKGSYTIKVMIGVAPDGTITFISKIYGGRWSDSAIFEQSGLIKLLDPGDAVMVDKGFLIDETCHRNRIHLIRPSFKRSKQFAEKDASVNNDISTARVHVERVNQRIKVFQILGETFPISLLPHFEKILLVICGTVNLSAPVLKDDKFMKDV